MTLVHLFGGTNARPDSINGYMNDLGGSCQNWGILNDSGQDVIDDTKWEPLLNQFKQNVQDGEIHGLINSAPQSTFSMAGGRRPLRGPSGKDRYGLPNLTSQEQEQVRIKSKSGSFKFSFSSPLACLS